MKVYYHVHKQHSGNDSADNQPVAREEVCLPCRRLSLATGYGELVGVYIEDA